jgi:hypothetical protein
MGKNILFALFLSLMSNIAAAQVLVDIANNATDPFNLEDTEPSIAVNPLNPLQIAVVSFSGGWSTATGERGPVWMSMDGGVTWAKNLVLTAPTAASTGSNDQKLVWAADGNLYIAELAAGENVPDGFIFRPSGSNWISGAAFGDDQPMIESTGTTRLAPWLNTVASPDRSMSERTTNNGVTVTQMGIGSTSFDNRTTRIAVGPTGAAYILYKTRQGGSGDFETATFRVMRSTNAGASWNSPGVPVHPGTVQTWFTSAWGNAKNGGKVGRARSSDGWIAVNPNSGDVWAVYCNRDASTFGQIYAVRSIDGGTTWNTPVRVSDGAHNSAYPEIAVASTGAVGVLYIDYDDSGAQTVYTHRMARSFDDGATWKRIGLQSLTTQTLANARDGYLWGDYEGLTVAGNQFFGVFTGQSIGRAVVQFDPIFFTISAVPPGIQVPAPVFDSACVGETQSTILNVCNTGTTDLVVTSIASANPEFAVAAPSAGLPVTISHDFCFPFQTSFTPAAAGTRTSDITITSSDSGFPTLHVTATGNVGRATAVTVIADSGDFGELCPGSNHFKDLAVTVNNRGTCPLLINSIVSSSSEFRVPQVLTFPIKVAPGGNIELPIRFEPSTAGPKAATLTLATNDPASPAVLSLSASVPPPYVCSPLALASIDGALGPTFGIGRTGNYTVNASGHVLRSFGPDHKFGVQIQGESMYYPRRREGQADLGILYRQGNWQAGLAGSLKTASLRSEIDPGSLSQVAISLDRLLPNVRIGAFLSRGIKDSDVVGVSETIGPPGPGGQAVIVRERVMHTVDTVGLDVQVNLIPPMWWLDANIASLKRYAPGAANKVGGAIRVSRQFQTWLVGMLQTDLNESFVGAHTVGTLTIGVTIGHWSRPADFSNSVNPLGALIPRIHYEVYDRVR